VVLAIHGGTPVSVRPWPRWPRAANTAKRLIAESLASDRWSISGPWSARDTLDQLASRRFAEFCGTAHALTMDHGSSALVAALLALEIGAGDEVIIPGLTWAACASAVLRVNAIPVPVDVDQQTLCMDPDAVANAITTRTKAILVVHLYGSMADLDALAAVARARGLALIEDSAQAHGAEWGGRRAGATGTIGTFSFHQGKPMATGEGGMAVTSDATLARKLEQIRGDGRTYGATRIGHQHLVFRGDMQGFNFCMPELASALLLDALERIEGENAQRLVNAGWLDSSLVAGGVWRPVAAYTKNEKRAYYHYAVQFDPDRLGGVSADMLAAALEAELRTPVTSPYPAMDAFDLLQPDRYPAWRGTDWQQRVVKANWHLPRANAASRTTLLLHHSVFLCEPERVVEIATAFDKVAAHADTLRTQATHA
jgi:dTDP-4-amino-4,6-dideoxygalactose transaminase